MFECWDLKQFILKKQLIHCFKTQFLFTLAVKSVPQVTDPKCWILTLLDVKSQRGSKILQWIKLQHKAFSPQHTACVKYEGRSQSQCGLVFVFLIFCIRWNCCQSREGPRLAPGKQHGISSKSHKYFKHSQCIGHFTLCNKNWSWSSWSCPVTEELILQEFSNKIHSRKWKRILVAHTSPKKNMLCVF